jgi:hypothetical protein
VQRFHLGVLCLENGLDLRFLCIGEVQKRGEIVHALRGTLVPAAGTWAIGRLRHSHANPQESDRKESGFHDFSEHFWCSLLRALSALFGCSYGANVAGAGSRRR